MPSFHEETRIETAEADEWLALLRTCVSASGAAAGALVARGDAGRWRVAAMWPEDDPVFRADEAADLVAGRTAREWRAPLREAGLELWCQHLEGVEEVAIWLRGREGWWAKGRETLALLATLPGLRMRARPVERLGGRIENLALVVDLVVLVNSTGKFREGVVKLVNETTARCRCQRVTLGWRKGGFCRALAVSHQDKVERKSPLVGLIEAAMDECAEQDVEIALPKSADEDAATRDHEALATEGKNPGILSLPLRERGEVAGVLLLERENPWGREEVAALRLTADLLTPVLAGMERRARWIGAQMWHGVRSAAGSLLGHEHTGWKLLGLAAAAAVAVLFLGGMTYKVEAPFVVETDAVALIAAPFDGYLDEVGIRVGDEVAAGAPLFSLDTRDLRLEEARVSADLSRHLAAAMKAEGAGELAEMNIAQAAAAQARARLDLARHRLAQARALAPFDAVVIEGDLREKLGSPLRQGDVMAKLVRLDEPHMELKIDERDIRNVAPGGEGELAFAANPAARVRFRIEGIDPGTRAGEEGNVFIARAVPLDGAEAWWRPGMGGVAKVHVGRRSFWWILTHRTTDFLRMKLWW